MNSALEFSRFSWRSHFADQDSSDEDEFQSLTRRQTTERVYLLSPESKKRQTTTAAPSPIEKRRSKGLKSSLLSQAVHLEEQPSSSFSSSSSSSSDNETKLLVEPTQTQLTSTSSVTSSPKIPLWRHIGFSLARMAGTASLAIQGYYLSVFLLEVVNLSAAYTATILLVKQMWDAFSDPIVGLLSDSTRTPWGRRKPWILGACIPTGLMWILLWLHLSDITIDVLNFFYYLVLLLIFNTLMTCVQVPYLSIIPDMATTYDERTFIAMLQEGFGLVGTMVSVVVVGELLVLFPSADPTLPDLQKGYVVSASIIASIFIILPMISAYCAVEKPPPALTDEEVEQRALRASGCRGACVWFSQWITTFFKLLWRVFKFRPFALLAFITCFLYFGISLFVTNWVFYMQYIFKKPEETQYTLLTVQGTMVVSFFVWGIITRYIGKKNTFVLGVVGWIGTLTGLFFLDEDSPSDLLYLVMVGRGFFGGVAYLIPMALLPDIAEVYVEKTGERNEALMYSLFILFQKLGQAIVMAAGTYILGGAGYINPEDLTEQQVIDGYQPDSVLLALRLLVCIVPIPLLVCSVVMIYFIPDQQKKPARCCRLTKRVTNRMTKRWSERQTN
mmetsp:Transcript_16709/g.24964  ORF Transcript_16709/g.24964 Transcript_16709/m.24964 type:complete len:615 (-) Transcript_16709:104-1948(-)